jgi:hypothetical protein
MSRVRVSTTVDKSSYPVLDGRAAGNRMRSSSMRRFVRSSSVTEPLNWIRSTSPFFAHPLDEPDEWGDLASFRQAAAGS